MIKQKNIIQKATDAVSQIFLQTDMSQNDIIVFSDVRWDSLFQRPQHLMSRFSKERKILFIEEPIHSTSKNMPRIRHPQKNITVLQPRMSLEDIPKMLPPLIEKQSKKLKLRNPLLWFYSAKFSEVIPYLQKSMIVYDCMNQLSLVKDVSSTLLVQEKYLLSAADVVFTVSKSLYEEKKKYTNNIYYFPDSVDQKHFAQGWEEELPIPKDIRSISYPVVGFYGTIDERLDTKLLAEVATEMPEVSFVVIGPVKKDLPSRKNIYYLGKKSYAKLPAYLSAFDIAMLPFVFNEKMQFINLTKIREFMAAGKPIISTAFADVQEYRDVLQVVNTADDFMKAIMYFLDESPLIQCEREDKYEGILAKTSWKRTVKQMNEIIQEVLLAKYEVKRGKKFSYDQYPHLRLEVK